MTSPAPLLETLLHASLGGALLAALALAAVRAWPRMPAAARAALLWLACARLLVALAPLPAIELPVLPAAAPFPARPASLAVPGPQGARGAPGTARSAPLASPVAAPSGVALASTGASGEASPSSRALAAGAWALAGAWLAGVAWSVARLVRERLRLGRLLRAARPVPDDHPAALAWLALGGGLRRIPFLPAPRLALSSAVRAPLCAGPLAPVVVLPAAPLPPRALALALAHELGHLRRGDLWLAWIPALAEIAFWFHPLARLAAREHAQAREEACDAFALGHTGVAAAEYGPLLVAFGTGHPRLALAAAAGAHHVRQLERRLRLLLSYSNPRRARWMSAAVLLAGAPALAPVALGSVAAPEELDGSDVRVKVAQAPPLPRKPEAAPPKAATPPKSPAPKKATPTGRTPEPAQPAPAAAPTPEPSAVPDEADDADAPEAPEAWAAASDPAPTAAPTPAPPARPPRAPRADRAAPTPPPAPPAPPVAAVPPVPPVPPAPSLALGGPGDYLVFKDDGDRMTVRIQDADDLEDVNAFLEGRTGPVIVFGREGRNYVVDDPAAIERFRALHEYGPTDEQAAASLDQARLGAEQAELGRRQADASARQARLNVQMAELSVAERGLRGKEREKLDSQRERLSTRMEEISREMDGIGRQMQGIGDRMEEIGRTMERDGERMEEQARRAEKETRKLVKEWIRSGVAKPLR